MAWLTGYNYRKKITIDGSSVGEQTDYQMKLNVYGKNVRLDRCDAITDWESDGSLSLDEANQQEGIGCLTVTHSNEGNFRKQFSIHIDSHTTEANGYFHLWVYVSDVTKLDASGVHIEISSSGTFDTNEYQWDVPRVSLSNGWNELALKISDYSSKTGTPDLSAINWFRIYDFKTASITIKIDDLYFYDIEDDGVILNEHCQDDFDDIRFTQSDGETELDHWREPSPEYIDKCTGGTVTASGENLPNEGKEKAFDDASSTKWLVFSPTGWIAYQFGSSLEWVVTKYTITSGNDAPERDPKDWKLKGSHNGSDWDDLDTRTSENQWTGRRQTRSFYFNNSTAYEYYMLDITAIGSGSTLQIAEIEFMVESSEQRVFWIEFDTIADDLGSTDFYIYYSKSGGASGSNGENTFPFFDDFPGSAIDTGKWEHNTEYASVAGSILTYNSTGSGGWKLINTIPNFGVGYRLRADILWDTLGENEFAIRDNDAQPFLDLYLDYPVSNKFRVFPGNGSQEVTTNIAIREYHIYEFWRLSDATHAYIDDVEMTNSPLAVGFVGDLPCQISTSVGRMEFDWVLFRKYVDPEPTWGTWGSEETLLASGWAGEYCGVSVAEFNGVIPSEINGV